MKHATGNLASGVIVAIAISVLVAFFSFAIWPMIKASFIRETGCDKAINSMSCAKQPDSNGYVECNYKGQTFKCPFKG